MMIMMKILKQENVQQNGHTNTFGKKISKARHLFNCEQTESANEHYLWPINETKTVDNTIKIKRERGAYANINAIMMANADMSCVFVLSLKRIISMNAGTQPENTNHCILRLVK